MVQNDKYSSVGYNLKDTCALYLTDYNQLTATKKINQVQLVIKDVKWFSSTQIKFYTDNPTSLNADKMGLIRRLEDVNYITNR